MYALSRQNKQLLRNFCTRNPTISLFAPPGRISGICSSLENFLLTSMLSSKLLLTHMLNLRVEAIMFEIQTLNLLFFCRKLIVGLITGLPTSWKNLENLKNLETQKTWKILEN